MLIITRHLSFWFTGIMIFPFIIVKDNKASRINHEKIHFQQALELLVVFFYIWYTLEYLIKLAYYRNHLMAYRNISFEKEAYTNQGNPYYLENRKRYSFLKS